MKSKLFRIITIIVAGSSVGLTESIINSAHNLSVGGTSEITSSAENELCIFCHAVHHGNGQTPLWNRYSGAVTYSTYGSPTLDAQTLQPGTSSRLCLSCHDGTIALGLVASRSVEIVFPAGLDKIPPGYRSNLQSDLSDDHPLELDMTTHSSGELTCTGCHDVHQPSEIRNLECTSCHDPHDDQFGNFLIMDPIGGAICMQCHVKTDWQLSSHAISTAQWNNAGTDPWPYSNLTTVADNACANCHVPHAAVSPYWLLQKNEEEVCLNCHTGNVAQSDVGSQFLKAYSHNVGNYSAVHQPNEDPLTMTDHSECTDCHDPHRANASATVAPAVSGPLTGVGGVNAQGQAVDPVSYGYEVCLKCHYDDLGGTYSNRQETLMIMEEFDVTNLSHHAVFGVGTGNSPSLMEPWATQQQIKCNDCHGNDSGSGDVHGSVYRAMLELYVDINDEHFGSSYNSANYELCYKCHDEMVIRSASSYKHHNRHLRAGISCTTCHDPHGSRLYPHLLSFNTDIVTNISYEDTDPNGIAGSCTMNCHGKVHVNKRY